MLLPEFPKTVFLFISTTFGTNYPTTKELYWQTFSLIAHSFPRGFMVQPARELRFFRQNAGLMR